VTILNSKASHEWAPPPRRSPLVFSLFTLAKFLLFWAGVLTVAGWLGLAVAPDHQKQTPHPLDTTTAGAPR